MSDEKTMIVRPYTLIEIARIYGVHYKTMSKWIKPFAEEVGRKNGRMYSVAQVRIILDKLGIPGEIKI